MCAGGAAVVSLLLWRDQRAVALGQLVRVHVDHVLQLRHYQVPPAEQLQHPSGWLWDTQFVRDVRAVAIADAFCEDWVVFGQVLPLPQGFWREVWSAMLCLKEGQLLGTKGEESRELTSQIVDQPVHGDLVFG